MAADTPERWQQIATLFDEALKVPPDRRGAFLESACSGDAELRRRVVELLEASGQAAAFLERPAVAGAAAILRKLADEPVPGSGSSECSDPSSPPTRSVATGGEARETVGPYRLLQKIGEGGMGEVWLAEQREPIHREVALKVIKAGMDTQQVVARFEAERQALALMDHPCIAKVFEAGETPRGLPYFAMEHVPGEPITHYCDRNRLTLQERLALFQQVCEGVQHAHQKGVIHRDLKPSNVLVMTVGNNPAAKIIDFGVAKATAQRLTERTLFTELGVMIGTPEYMSPEQADLTGLDVDTRTDVYALGVMLYELLTGVLPFEPKELRQAGFEEIRRRIREVDPPRPSTRLRALGARSTEAAQRRRTEPRKLVSRLKGDLDWIVMKAMEKDRTRRYGSAAELTAEIERHVNNEPILAGPPGASYRAGKFVRRHRFGVAVVSVGIAGLVAFGVVMAAQARRIAKERNRAERVSEFLTDLFNVSDPRKARGNTVTAREILDTGAQKIEKELAKEPEVQVQLMLTIGLVYMRLGLDDKAEPLLERSNEIGRRMLGPDHPETLKSIEYLASIYEHRGRYEEAEKLEGALLETRRRVLGEEHPHTLQSMDMLGYTYARHGRVEEALKLQLKVLEARRRVLPENDYRILNSMGDVAWSYESLGRHKEAETLYQQALEIGRQALGPDDPSTLRNMSGLGVVARSQKRYDEAEKLFRETYEMQRRVLGPEHPGTLRTRENLAETIMDQGRLEESRGIYLEILETRRRVLGPEHPGTILTLVNLGGLCDREKHYPEAEAFVRQAYEARRRMLGDEHPDTLSLMRWLGTIERSEGKYREAESQFGETYQIRRRVLGPEHPDTLDTREDLAGMAMNQGRLEEARGIYLEILESRRRVQGADHPGTFNTLSNLGRVCDLEGRPAEAEVFIRQAYEGQRRVLGEDDPATLMTRDALAGVIKDQGRLDEARGIYLEVREARRRVLGAEHPSTMATANNLAAVLLDQKRYKEAEDLFRQVLEVDRRVLGPDHPTTLVALNNLGEVCADQNRLDEADAFYKQAFEGSNRVLGPRHPDTLGIQIGLAGVAALRGQRGRALATIRQAVEAGYNDPYDEMEKQATLSPLHGVPEFKRLLAQARGNRGKRTPDVP